VQDAFKQESHPEHDKVMPQAPALAAIVQIPDTRTRTEKTQQKSSSSCQHSRTAIQKAKRKSSAFNKQRAEEDAKRLLLTWAKKLS